MRLTKAVEENPDLSRVNFSKGIILSSEGGSRARRGRNISGDVPEHASFLLKREIISRIYDVLLIHDIPNTEQLRSEANSISTFD